MKKNILVKDLFISFLREGIHGLEVPFDTGRLTRRHATELVQMAQDNHRLSPELEGWLAQHFPEAMNVRGRGRPLPDLHSPRDYLVQQVGDGRPFVLLPVSVLGLKKGDILSVRFNENNLVGTPV